MILVEIHRGRGEKEEHMDFQYDVPCGCNKKPSPTIKISIKTGHGHIWYKCPIFLHLFHYIIWILCVILHIPLWFSSNGASWLFSENLVHYKTLHNSFFSYKEFCLPMWFFLFKDSHHVHQSKTTMQLKFSYS